MAENSFDRISKLEIGDAEEVCLWDRLPRELQNKVLNHLPVKTLFQARCVCKAWHHAILRRDFATTFDAFHTSGPPTLSTLSLTPSSLSWSLYESPQALWQKRTTLSPNSHPKLTRQETSFCSVHPVGGLLVLRFWKMGVNHWVVWNPLTCKWKTLPSSKHRTSKATVAFVHAFVAEETPRRYKILMAFNPRRDRDLFWSSWPEESRRMVTEVYDSATGAWTQSVSTLRVPVAQDAWGMDEPSGVLSDGVIHFVARSRDCESVLYCFDTVSEQWRDEAVTLEGCWWVFAWDGRVMTTVSSHEDEELVVYQWDPGMRRWVDAAIRIPVSMTIAGVEFSTCDERGAIVAEGDRLVISGRYGVHAVYRKAEDCWTYVTPCHEQVEDPDVNCSRLFLFKPKPDWAP